MFLETHYFRPNLNQYDVRLFRLHGLLSLTMIENVYSEIVSVTSNEIEKLQLMQYTLFNAQAHLLSVAVNAVSFLI